MMGERRIIPVTPNKRRAPALYELIGNKERESPETGPGSGPGSGAGGASAAPSAPAPRAPGGPASRPVVTPNRPAPAEAARGPAAAAPTIASPRVLEPVAATASSRVVSPGSEEDDDGTKVFGITPGSRLNIPVGFAFIAMAVVIAAVLGAYMLGYDKRSREARLEEERIAARESGSIVDPMRLPIEGLSDAAGRQGPKPTAGPGTAGSNQPRGEEPPASASKNPAPKPPEAREAPGGASQPRLIVVKSAKEDPRKDGLNYPTVASLPIREATAAGEYLVSKGYTTALVPSPSDPRLFMVIPLIGVERSNYQKGSEAAARTLRDLGRAFKRDMKGATDFNDLFWMKYER